jgi:hypothetical protein
MNRPGEGDKRKAQYISLKAKRGRKKTESSKSGRIPESKKQQGAF